MNTPVSFELDKLLLSKNIDMPVNPTISDVVMWLYEKHGIWIYVDEDFRPQVFDENGFDLNYEGQINRIIVSIAKNIIVYTWDTPTEAYEAAIIYTLNNLRYEIK